MLAVGNSKDSAGTSSLSLPKRLSKDWETSASKSKVSLGAEGEVSAGDSVLAVGNSKDSTGTSSLSLPKRLSKDWETSASKSNVSLGDAGAASAGVSTLLAVGNSKDSVGMSSLSLPKRLSKDWETSASKSNVSLGDAGAASAGVSTLLAVGNSMDSAVGETFSFDGADFVGTNSSGNSSSPKISSKASERVCGLSSALGTVKDSGEASSTAPIAFSSGNVSDSVSCVPKIPDKAAEISFPSISSTGKKSFSVLVGAKPAIASFKLCSKSLNETSPSFSSSVGVMEAKEANGSSSSTADCSEATSGLFSSKGSSATGKSNGCS